MHEPTRQRGSLLLGQLLKPPLDLPLQALAFLWQCRLFAQQCQEFRKRIRALLGQHQRKRFFLGVRSPHREAAILGQVLHQRIEPLLVPGEDDALGLRMLGQHLAQIERDAEVHRVGRHVLDQDIAEPLAHRLRLAGQLNRQFRLLRPEHKAHVHVIGQLLELDVLHILKVDEQHSACHCTASHHSRSQYLSMPMSCP